MGDLLVSPSLGSVAFGSGKECWAFTLTRMARMYASKFKIEPKKLQEKFWGDNFYDAENKIWSSDNISKTGKSLKRTFAQFIMDPICKLANAIMEGNMEVTTKMLDVLGVKLA